MTEMQLFPALGLDSNKRQRYDLKAELIRANKRAGEDSCVGFLIEELKLLFSRCENFG